VDRAVSFLALDGARNEVAGEFKPQRHLADCIVVGVAAPFEQKAGSGKMNSRRAADLQDVFVGKDGSTAARQTSGNRDAEENSFSGPQSVAP
jgi:hypothetical protein